MADRRLKRTREAYQGENVMITGDIDTILRDQALLTVSDLMSVLDVQAQAIMAILVEALKTADPAQVHIILALLFGSMALDAEMQQDIRQTPYTFENRLSLFKVHAETAYRESAQFVKDHHIYSSVKETH